jgi:hypothetical protein
MSKMKVIQDQIPLGVYVWATKDGILCDEEGRVLNIPGEKDNQEHIKKIADAAAWYGFKDGNAVFLPGRRQVSDEEYEHQKSRMKAGLTPDPYDVASNIEDIINKEQQRD